MEQDEEVVSARTSSPTTTPPFPSRTPWWAWTYPILAWIILIIHFLVGANVFIDVIAAIALIATVFAAVHHAEVIAQRIGEPFGTLVLAIAVTIIETSLILSVMITGGPGASTLARDTVFASVMIACNGVLGLCLLAGGMRHYEQSFQIQGTSAALAVLAALTVLSLVLPNLTTSVPGPFFNTPSSSLLGWFLWFSTYPLFLCRPSATGRISFPLRAMAKTKITWRFRRLVQLRPVSYFSWRLSSA